MHEGEKGQLAAANFVPPYSNPKRVPVNIKQSLCKPWTCLWVIAPLYINVIVFSFICMSMQITATPPRIGDGWAVRAFSWFAMEGKMSTWSIVQWTIKLPQWAQYYLSLFECNLAQQLWTVSESCLAPCDKNTKRLWRGNWAKWLMST